MQLQIFFFIFILLFIYFQQMMRYFLGDYAPKILNYAQIIQSVEYFTIFFSEMSQFIKLANLLWFYF